MKALIPKLVMSKKGTAARPLFRGLHPFTSPWERFSKRSSSPDGGREAIKKKHCPPCSHPDSPPVAAPGGCERKLLRLVAHGSLLRLRNLGWRYSFHSFRGWGSCRNDEISK
jgi:hypothetical protein